MPDARPTQGRPAAQTASPLPAPPLPAPPWRIGVDVGGTFTDLVIGGGDGGLRVFKVPSVPRDPSQGVLNALESAAVAAGIGIAELLGGCELFVHGSTVATNTILERKGAKVGMLTTEGFRDSLEIRRGLRENMWDHRAPFPEVLVPRFLRQPVRGRIAADGGELAALETEDVTAAAALFAEEGVESVAIVLLNSFVNPAHEEAAEAALRRTGWAGGGNGKGGEGAWICRSAAVSPVMGEYERGSTAVVNAYIAPKVVAYLTALQDRLRQLGLRHPVLLIQSNGGAVSVAQAAERPVNLVLSGPAAGVGALQLYSGPAGSGDLIAMEIGGTSCDVTLMGQGRVPVTDELVIDGYHLSTPSVEIHTVGAGGGTLAWVDGAGLLHVGPQGAGAVPGPACYGLGGERPTVTDAQLVLGRLRGGPYAGGSIALDAGLAEQAVRKHVADPLGLAVDAAAAGIIRLLEQRLLHAVERISIERGHDPARFTLVAAGGAGPMHGATVGRVLGCRRVYIPRAAGAFCAVGMLHADIRQDFLRVFFGDLDRVEEEELATAFAPLTAQAEQALAAEGFAAGRQHLTRTLDLRYRGQQWSIKVPVAEGAPADLAGAGIRIDRAAAREAFEAEHDRQYGHIQPGGDIQITGLRVTAVGGLERALPPAVEGSAAPPRPVEERRVYVDAALGWRTLPVYAGADLRPGTRLSGPLLVEEATTTLFAGPGDDLAVDASDNYLLTLDTGVAA